MTSELHRKSDRGRAFGPGLCPVCDAGIADGDLCMTHRAALERDVPEKLVKITPPKWCSEAGHGVPDALYTVLLIIAVLILLHLLGVLEINR